MADITAPLPLILVMEWNVVFERESLAHKEESSLEEEKEINECDWSVIEVNALFVQFRVPFPT